MASHLDRWKPEEDQRLVELVEAGKSWVLISAILKRGVGALRDRYQRLRQRSAKL